MTKNPTINDFYHVHYIPWTSIEEVLGKRQYKKFMKWMNGQTCLEEGVYPQDLKRWLRCQELGIKLD